MNKPGDISKLNLFRSEKLPVILQAEIAECGLACLAMIAGYHGHNIGLHELRRRVVVSQSGTNLEFVAKIAEQLGLMARPVRLEMEDLKLLKKPAILHWGLNHFVVLKAVNRKSITIHDPANGKRTILLGEVSKLFTGVAVEFTPSADLEPREVKEKVKLWDLWSRMTGFLGTAIQILVLTLILQVFSVIAPLVNQLVIDNAITSGDTNFLSLVIFGFFLLLLLQTVVEVLRYYVGMYFSSLLNFQMRSNVLKHLLRLPANFFEKRHVGDITSRMRSLKPVQELFTNAFIIVFLDGIMVFITFTVMYLYSPMLAGVVLGVFALSFGVRLAAFPYILRIKEEQIQKDASLNTILLETIRGARAIKIFGRERERHSLWQNTFADSMNVGLTLERFNIIGKSTRNFVFGSLDLGVFFLGAMLVINQQLSLGMFFAFQAYRLQFGNRATSIVELYFSFRTVGLHLERLADIIYADPEVGIDKKFEDQQELTGLIEVRKLRFRYGDNEQWVVNDVSFTINPGDRVALVGPSGGGKTTLLKILIGLEQPVEGEVLYDGRPISRTGTRAIRHQIGVVMQDDRLLSGSLYDNIGFFDPEIDTERVEQCAKLAHVHQEIMDMPMGFESLIGDMGSILSGGQKQRVLLARALYRDSSFLFLDEGTANLDLRTEQQVISELSKMKQTQVVVAHRKGAISHCNRFLKVEGGSIQEIDDPQGYL